MGNIEYKQIAKARVQKNRNIVISRCSKGGYTLAQQLEVVEDDKVIPVYLKGAFHVDDVQGLIELRDAINLVVNIADKH
jgi:hypothetical protein